MTGVELSVVDYVIFSLTLAVPAIVGIYHAYKSRRQSGTESYLLAGRKMKTVPVSLSSFATTISTIAFVGYPAEAYTYGIQIAFAAFGFILSIPVTCGIFLPVFYNQNITSVFEFLSRRFNYATRRLCSTLFVLLMTFYISVIIYGTSTVLTYVTGFSTWTASTAVCLVCTFYTTLGGMKAVIWTDFLQAFIMFATMFFIFGKGVIEVGGFDVVWKKSKDSHRLDVDFDPDPFKRLTFWTVTFGIFFVSIVHNNANQIVIQRYFSCPTLKVAKRTVIISSCVSAIVLVTFSFVGLILYAAYEYCDPLENKVITSRNQLIPLFLTSITRGVPGLIGLIVAGLCSAALSTLSSACNSLAAIVLEDLIRPSKPDISDQNALLISRILSASYGLLCLGFTGVASVFPNVLPAATQSLNIIGAPILAVFLVGIAFPHCNSKGAMAGFLSGLVVSLWICIGTMMNSPRIPELPTSIEGCNSTAPFNNTFWGNNEAIVQNITTTTSLLTDNKDVTNDEFSFYSLSYMLHGPLSFFIAVVVALLTSLVTGSDTSGDQSFLSPALSKAYSRAPNFVKTFVGFRDSPSMQLEDSNLMKATSSPLVEKLKSDFGTTNELSETEPLPNNDRRDS